MYLSRNYSLGSLFNHLIAMGRRKAVQVCLIVSHNKVIRFSPINWHPICPIIWIINAKRDGNLAFSIGLGIVGVEYVVFPRKRIAGNGTVPCDRPKLLYANRLISEREDLCTITSQDFTTAIDEVREVNSMFSRTSPGYSERSVQHRVGIG